MNENLQTIENYEDISNDIKFLPKSRIRLSILETLYERPMNMKEMNDKTKFNYSSISTTMHMLELNEHIYRENNRYALSNVMHSHMGDIIKLGKIMVLLDMLAPISQDHIVSPIPLDSIETIYYLEKIRLIEADDLNIYKTYDYIEKSIKNAKYVNAILPFSYDRFNNQFNKLLSKNNEIHLITPLNIKESLIKNLNTLRKNLKIDYVDKSELNFIVLLCTDKKMMLGFLKDDGVYDQNRLLISDEKNCVKWANELFENFKKENRLNGY